MMFDMEIPVCVRTPTAELRGSCLASGYLLKPKSRRYKKTIDATISSLTNLPSPSVIRESFSCLVARRLAPAGSSLKARTPGTNPFHSGRPPPCPTDILYPPKRICNPDALE